MKITTTKLRGHEIYTENGKDWFYSDDGSPTLKHRPCRFCQKPNTEGDHDPCIANLPHVKNACCGHGEPESAYVQFMDGSAIRGFEAITLQSVLKL